MYEIFVKLLEQKGVKASEVAKSLGMHQSVFTDWKTGRSKPKIDKLKKIAAYFGVSLDYLAYGEIPKGYYENDETAKMAQTLLERSDLKILFDLAEDATPQDVETAVSVLMALKEKESK